MLNIQDILNYVYEGVASEDPRFVVEDSEHVLDTKTGIEFHLYDDGGKITHGETIIAKLTYFTNEEQSILMGIKKHITDPEVFEEKIAHYPVMLREARETFASLYESPRPSINARPISEANTTPYTG